MATQLSDQLLFHKAQDDTPAEATVSSSKSILCVPDNNQGNYSGQITFDAQSQLTGSSKMTSLEDSYLVIPYTATMKVSGAIPDPSKAFNRFSLCPKFNVASIIDSISVELGNRTILTEQAFKQYWANYILPWTETTQEELAKHGDDRLLYLDPWYSINHSSGTTSFNGDGFSNNSLNRTSSNAAAPTLDLDFSEGGTQEPYAFNEALLKRLIANAPMVVDKDESAKTFGWPSMGGKATKNIIEQTGKSCFREYAAPARDIANGNLASGEHGYVGSWFWLHKIRLTDLHPIFKALPLMANCQLKLKLRLNVGKFEITGTGGGQYTISSSVMSSGKTCPIMLPSGYTGNPLEGRIISGTKISVAYGPIKNDFSNPLIEGSGFFPFHQARLYVSQYEFANPTSLISSPVRTVRYLDCYAQMFDKKAGIGINGDGMQLNAPFTLQASGAHKNIKYCCLLPFAETTGNYYSLSALPQYQSPVDSCPATLHPGSCIRNFQLEIGGSSVFNNIKEYDFSSFRDEVAKLNAVNGDLGRFNSGLLTENQWGYANRMLVADVSRISHKDVPASVVVSGVNGSSQGSDLLLLIVYERDLELDILTGEVLSFN